MRNAIKWMNGNQHDLESNRRRLPCGSGRRHVANYSSAADRPAKWVGNSRALRRERKAKTTTRGARAKDSGERCFRTDGGANGERRDGSIGAAVTSTSKRKGAKMPGRARVGERRESVHGARRRSEHPGPRRRRGR